jgi:hypothetical protein
MHTILLPVVNLNSCCLSDHSRHKIVSDKISFEYNIDYIARLLKVGRNTDIKENLERLTECNRAIKENDLFYHFVIDSTAETHSFPPFTGLPYFTKC